jgi:serine/threonine protein kinase
VAFGEERGRSSDVFSLGCIFLELFTVLTDRGTFQDCRLRRRTGNDPSYHANMERVNNWIDELIHGELSLAPMLYNSRVCLLFAVRGILNHDRKKRPSAADIWKLTTSNSLDIKEHSGNSEYRPRLCGACCFNQLQE